MIIVEITRNKQNVAILLRRILNGFKWLTKSFGISLSATEFVALVLINLGVFTRNSSLLKTIILTLFIATFIGCSNSTDSEGGKKLGLTDTYDKVRNGERLIMTYNVSSFNFSGTVENVTSQTIPNVRIEVHLSNGTKLGPTPWVNLAPGQVEDVALSATG